MPSLPNLSALSLRAAHDTDMGLNDFTDDLLVQIVQSGLADESTLRGVCENLDSGRLNVMHMGQGSRRWRDAAQTVRKERNKDVFFETLYRRLFPALADDATPAQAVPPNGIVFSEAANLVYGSDIDIPTELQNPVTWKGAFRAACNTLQRLDYVRQNWSGWNNGPDWRHFFPVWLHNKTFLLVFGQLTWWFNDMVFGNWPKVGDFCHQFMEVVEGLEVVEGSLHLAEDVEFMVEMMFVTHGRLLEYLSTTMKDNRRVVLAAVRSYRPALQHASARLRADKTVVLEAVRRSGLALQHASEELREDVVVVLEAVSKHQDALKYASKQLRKNKLVVLTAVSVYGAALEHASKALKADKEVVLAAVSNDGLALQHASAELKADREVVRKALESTSGPTTTVLGYASEELQADETLRALALHLV